MLTDCIIQQHETEDGIFRAFDNVNMAVTIVMNGINLIRLNPCIIKQNLFLRIH